MSVTKKAQAILPFIIIRNAIVVILTPLIRNLLPLRVMRIAMVTVVKCVVVQILILYTNLILTQIAIA